MSSSFPPTAQTDTGPDAFALRLSPALRSILWFAGLVCGLVLSWQPLLDHLAYFERYGEWVYQLVLAGLACLALALPLYQWVRRRFLWRYELLILAAFTLIACLARAPWAVVTVLWILLACYLCGDFLIERLGLEIDRPTEAVSLSVAVGLGSAICVLFVLGLVGGYYWWVFALLFGLPCLVLARRLRRLGSTLRGFHETWRETEDFRRPVFAIVFIFSAAFIGVTLISALTPSLVYDAKLLHLPSIKFYAAIHGLKALPWVNYSYFPQGAEVVQTAAFSLGGQYAVQLLTPGVFAVALMLLYGIARRMGADRAATLGAVLLAASVPFIHWTGSVVKNDVYLALFQTAALYCVLRAWQVGPATWLRIGAFCLAMSFGIKHIAIFGGVALGIIVLVQLFRRPNPFRLAASLTLIFLLFGTFWHARTYLETGNPVFPKELSGATTQLGPVYGMELEENEPGRLFFPLTFHFDGRKVFASATANPLGMFLVTCWTVWLFVWRRKGSAVERVCLLFCLLYTLYWAWIWGILRYAIVPFLLLFVVTGLRFLSFAQQSGRIVRWSAQAAMAYALAFSLLVASMIHEVSFAQLRLLAGRSDEAEFLSTVEADYPPLAFLSTVLDADDRVIGVRDCARTYVPPLTEYFCAGLGGKNRDRSLYRVVVRLSKGEDWDYLVVPVEDRVDFVSGLSTLRRVTPVYEDRSYAVLQLAQPPTS